LRAAGESVELLFLLEAWPPPPRRPLLDALRLNSHQVRFLVAALRRNLTALRGLGLVRGLRALVHGARAVAEMASQRDVYRGDRARMYVDRVSLANEQALLRYRVRPYDGMLRLAIATKRSFIGDDARRVWQAMAPHNYAQIELPATDSGTMLLLPCAEPLAEWMRRSIDEVDGRAAPHAGHVARPASA
jgi:thioesterase domain-containing protein